MKKSIITAAVMAVIFLTSCEKGEREIRRLNSGSGIWEIESLRYDSYDSAGVSVVSSTTIDKPGELVFFTSRTMNALFSHYMVVANMVDTSGIIISNPGMIYFDGARANFSEDPDGSHNFPDELEGLWTVIEDKRKRQEWTICSTANGALAVKTTMILKKK